MKTIRLYHQAGQWYKLPNTDPLDDPLDDPLESLVKMVKLWLIDLLGAPLAYLLM